jgi:hypothetical protein
MFDEQQCIKCVRIAGAFPRKTVEQLVEAMNDERDVKVATEAKKQWSEAEGNVEKLANEEALGWEGDEESVATHRKCGYRMSRKYGFLTTREFSDEFGIETKAIPSLKVVSRWSEDGSRKLDGIAFKPMAGDELKYRILEHFWETSVFKGKTVMRPNDRLRLQQPEEAFAAEVKEDLLDHPAALSGGNHSISSHVC